MSNSETRQSLVRTAINLVVGVSTYAVATAVIKNNVAEPESTPQKAMLAVGSFALGHAVADKATTWSDAQIDTLSRSWHKATSKVAADKQKNDTNS